MTQCHYRPVQSASTAVGLATQTGRKSSEEDGPSLNRQNRTLLAPPLTPKLPSRRVLQGFPPKTADIRPQRPGSSGPGAPFRSILAQSQKCFRPSASNRRLFSPNPTLVLW